MVFGMPSALFPAFALHRLGGDASTVGYLYAAPYAGALAGSLVSGWTSHVRRQGLGGDLLGVRCGGRRSPAFGFMTSLWPALVLLAVAGGADFYSAVLRSMILLRSTPDHLRGRLRGIEFMQVASAPSLGDLEAGVLASFTSLRFSIVSGGVAVHRRLRRDCARAAGASCTTTHARSPVGEPRRRSPHEVAPELIGAEL